MLESFHSSNRDRSIVNVEYFLQVIRDSWDINPEGAELPLDGSGRGWRIASTVSEKI